MILRLLLACSLCLPWLLPSAAPKPNIIVIFTDDQGYGDLSRNDSVGNGERARPPGAANRRPRRLASERVAKPKGVRLARRLDVAREGAGHCARGAGALPINCIVPAQMLPITGTP